MDVVYVTRDGVKIGTLRGKKPSQWDFHLKYQELGARERTPKHIHLIVDLFLKQSRAPDIVSKLREHLLATFDRLSSASQYPPTLQVFRTGDDESFLMLNHQGEYSVEFIMVVIELLMIQEITNFSGKSLMRKLIQDLDKPDRFSVIQAATVKAARRAI